MGKTMIPAGVPEWLRQTADDMDELSVVVRGGGEKKLAEVLTGQALHYRSIADNYDDKSDRSYVRGLALGQMEAFWGQIPWGQVQPGDERWRTPGGRLNLLFRLVRGAGLIVNDLDDAEAA